MIYDKSKIQLRAWASFLINYIINVLKFIFNTKFLKIFRNNENILMLLNTGTYKTNTLNNIKLTPKSIVHKLFNTLIRNFSFLFQVYSPTSSSHSQ